MRHSVMAAAAVTALVVGGLPALAQGAGAAPIPAAVAHAPKPPAARTLIVRVTGLAAGARPRVTVTGPRHFHRSLTAATTLHRLTPGTYRLRIAPTRAAHGAHDYPAQSTLIAKVTGSRGAVATVTYATLVPKTTKTLATHSISHVTSLRNGRKLVQVRPGSGLQKGDILAAGVGPQTPDGLLDKVISVSGASVIVAPATLLDALPTGQIDTQAVLTSNNETSQAKRVGLRMPATDGPIEKKVDEPLVKCSGSVEAKASGSISISPSFHLSASWSLLHGVTAASLTADITESSNLKASISASGSCSGEVDLFKKPVTFATFEVQVGPLPVVLQPQLQITLSGEAKADAAITTSAAQSLTITAGLKYRRGSGISPIDTVMKKLSYQPPTLTASGSIEVSVNPEINLLIDGIGGPEIGLTGGLKLSADVNKDPWWTLDGYLAGNVGITVPLLKFDKRVELGRKTWEIAHAGEKADPSIDVSSDVVFPWNSDVCGFDTDQEYFNVDGSNFPGGSSVDVSTDWTDYGTTGVADDGTFDVSEPVGEVSDADHTDYGVYADPASSSVELNANSCISPVQDSDGTVTLQWGVNGYSADTDVDLYIDDDYTDSGTTDDGGSGGSTISFDCPDDGQYTWNVDGTDNDHDETNEVGDITESCTPADSTSVTKTALRTTRTRPGQIAAGATG